MSMAIDPSTPGFDWSARVRTTAIEALRYSRYVALMKRLLSLGAFLIIAAVLAFFFVASEELNQERGELFGGAPEALTGK